jgi:hypothetical protein
MRPILRVTLTRTFKEGKMMFKKSALAVFALLLAGSVFAKDEGGSKKKPGRPVRIERA